MDSKTVVVNKMAAVFEVSVKRNLDKVLLHLVASSCRLDSKIKCYVKGTNLSFRGSARTTTGLPQRRAKSRWTPQLKLFRNNNTLDPVEDINTLRKCDKNIEGLLLVEILFCLNGISITLEYLSMSPMVGKLPLKSISVEFFLVCEKNRLKQTL